MGEILAKSGSLIFIIFLGFVLRQINFVKKEDCRTLLHIYMNATLPAAVIASFRGFERNLSLLFVAFIAIFMNAVMSLTGYLAGRKGGKEEQSFGIINYSGYNVGAFAMPFLQNYLGPAGIMVASIFDAGNALMCSGMTFVMASFVMDETSRNKLKEIPGKLLRIVPFDVYMSMLILYLLNIHLPDSIYRIAGKIGEANTFLAMFAIGASIRLDFSRGKLQSIVKNLMFRYGISALMAAVIYFVLPFDLFIRQILVIIAFAPVSSITVVNTAKCGLDEERAGVVNSATILISLWLIMILVSLMKL